MNAKPASLTVGEPPQEGPAGDESDMKTEGAVVFIRESWVRTLCVKHLEEAVDVVLAVLGPLAAIRGKEADFCEQGAPVF